MASDGCLTPRVTGSRAPLPAWTPERLPPVPWVSTAKAWEPPLPLLLPELPPPESTAVRWRGGVCTRGLAGRAGVGMRESGCVLLHWRVCDPRGSSRVGSELVLFCFCIRADKGKERGAGAVLFL